MKTNHYPNKITFHSVTIVSTLTFPYTKYSSTSSTDKYVLKYKYQIQVLYLIPTLVVVSLVCECMCVCSHSYVTSDQTTHALLYVVPITHAHV